jgi:hypothetical protein
MLILVVAFAGLVLGLLRGGSLGGLAQLSFRWIPLVIAGLGLQFLIFPLLGGASIVPTQYIPLLYILSMALLAIWVVLNRHIPGIVLMGIGLLMNMAAIVANGGYMPINTDAANALGQSRDPAVGGTEIRNHSRATRGPVQLWIFTDILLITGIGWFSSVFSIGDVLLAFGASRLLYCSVQRPESASRDAPLVGEPAELSPQNDAHR